MTHPNRIFCRRRSGLSVCVNLICPTHIDASVGPELDIMSIGAGMWNRGSTNRRFLGMSIVDRSIG
jgi:hypothetical protein